MGGALQVIEASTKTELREQVKQWERRARNTGMDIRLGYDPNNVVKTASGYSIQVWAHS